MLLACLAAVDFALWDIRGKSVNRPVCALFPDHRSVVPTYANLGHVVEPDRVAAVAVEYVRQGHRALKIRGSQAVGTPADATNRLRAVHEAVGPDVLLMIDINGTWDVATALVELDRW